MCAHTETHIYIITNKVFFFKGVGYKEDAAFSCFLCYFPILATELTRVRLLCGVSPVSSRKIISAQWPWKEGRSIGPINGRVQSTLVEPGKSCSLSKVPNIVGLRSFTVGHVGTELLHDQASNFTLRSQETTLYLVLSIIFLLFSYPSRLPHRSSLLLQAYPPDNCSKRENCGLESEPNN